MADATKQGAAAPAKPGYVPTKDEQDLMQEWLDRKRTKVPRITVRIDDDGRVAAKNNHPDNALGALLLIKALGLDSTGEYTLFLSHMLSMTEQNKGPEHIEKQLNEIVSLVVGQRPKDLTEAMLCLQMAAVQLAIGRSMYSVMNSEALEVRSENSNAVNKLSRTFTMQMDALKRYRTKGREQKVVVEHKHYNYVAPGAQAVFGDVTATGEGGGVQQESASQSHGRMAPVRKLTVVGSVPSAFDLAKEIVTVGGGDEAA